MQAVIGGVTLFFGSIIIVVVARETNFLGNLLEAFKMALGQ